MHGEEQRGNPAAETQIATSRPLPTAGQGFE